MEIISQQKTILFSNLSTIVAASGIDGPEFQLSDFCGQLTLFKL